MKLLIEAKINLEASCSGTTGFMYACKKGHTEIVKLLIEADVNLEAKDTTGGGITAFLYACKKGHIKIVKLLIAAKVNLEAKGYYGKTGFLFACEKGQTEIVNLLIEEEVNLEAKTSFGWTGFIYACKECHIEILKALIQVGVNIDLPRPRIQRKYEFQRKNYIKTQNQCQAEIEKWKEIKENLKELWIDFDLLIIDTICEFSNDEKALEKIVITIEEILNF